MNESAAGYLRTDLASELDLSDRSGIREHSESPFGIPVTTTEILTEAAAERLGKPPGRYVTVDVGRIWLASDAQFEAAGHTLGQKLREMAADLCGSPPPSILIAGLGNRQITADAIGDETVHRITVTRHIRDNRALYELFGGCEISAVIPGVLGQTGIESAEIIRGAADHVKPALVIAVDALCARSIDRLATTVQLGSTGICPGSGVGNRRLALNRETLGCPVIAVGVPTVVDSSTLIVDSLAKAGMEELPPSLEAVLEGGRSFFVTPKETDSIIRELSRLLADAITQAFQSPAS